MKTLIKTTTLLLFLTAGCRADFSADDFGDAETGIYVETGDETGTGDSFGSETGSGTGSGTTTGSETTGDGDGDGDGDGETTGQDPDVLPGLNQRCNPHLALEGGFACNNVDLVCMSDTFDEILNGVVFRCRPFQPKLGSPGEYGDTCRTRTIFDDPVVSTCAPGLECMLNEYLPPGFSNQGEPSDSQQHASCTLQCNPALGNSQCGGGMFCKPLWGLQSLDPMIAADGPMGVCWGTQSGHCGRYPEDC